MDFRFVVLIPSRKPPFRLEDYLVREELEKNVTMINVFLGFHEELKELVSN